VGLGYGQHMEIEIAVGLTRGEDGQPLVGRTFSSQVDWEVIEWIGDKLAG